MIGVVLMYWDYYAGGMIMPGRSASSDSYRYGFGGQEKDDEIKGEGNSLNYTFRMYDPRVVRFFAVDPIASDYPELTPYQHSSLNPIWMVEIEGLEGEPSQKVTATISGGLKLALFTGKGLAKSLQGTFGLSMNVPQSSESLLGSNNVKINFAGSTTFNFSPWYMKQTVVTAGSSASISQNGNGIGSVKLKTTFAVDEEGVSAGLGTGVSAPSGKPKGQSQAEGVAGLAKPMDLGRNKAVVLLKDEEVSYPGFTKSTPEQYQLTVPDNNQPAPLTGDIGTDLLNFGNNTSFGNNSSFPTSQGNTGGGQGEDNWNYTRMPSGSGSSEGGQTRFWNPDVQE